MTDTTATRSSMHAECAALPLVFSTFAMFGLLYGVWQVALPYLQEALGMSDGALGAAITAGFVASFPVMLVGGRLADRWGTRTLIASRALIMPWCLARWWR